MSAEHPSLQALDDWAAGRLAGDERSRVAAHLSDCAACRACNPDVTAVAASGALSPDWLEQTHSPSAPTSADATDQLAVGSQVGRYLITGRIGRGAMGVVLAAFDPRLQRKVAIKLLRADLPTVESASLRARLLREAQSLAKLSHPNVVQVYDVGDHGDSVFLAMDLVEGSTLAQWLRAAPRPRPQVQRLFEMVAQGLVAAHAAGLVHRDVKPDNILVDTNGNALITDFGLSRRAGPPDDDNEDTITGRGSLVGTPAYMSPEQFDGDSADPRSDQFGFCVALYEALCGQLPFAGTTLQELSTATHTGAVRPMPPGRRVPGWLRALLLRGLSPRADDRFPSMEALLERLRRRRERQVWIGLGVAAAATATVLAFVLSAREVARQRENPCAQVEARLASVWGPSQRAATATAFLRNGSRFAPQVLTLTEKQLDAYAATWTTGYRAACGDLRRVGHGDVATLARLACLEQQLSGLGALTTRLSVADDTVVENAALAVDALPRPDACVTARTLPTELADPVLRTRAAEVERAIAAADARRLTGDYEGAASAARAEGEEAGQLGLRALQSAALNLEGVALRELNQLSEAEARGLQASRLAEASRADEAAARARLEVAWTIGVAMGDRVRGKAALLDARAAVDRVGRDPWLELEELTLEAELAYRDGLLDKALELQRKMVSSTERLKGPRSASMAVALSSLSRMERTGGLYEAALADNQRALELFEEVAGPQHPRVAATLTNRAGIFTSQGLDAAALGPATRAVEILTSSQRGNLDTVQAATFNLGLLYKRLHRSKEALPYIEKALALAHQSYPAGTALSAQYATGLAETLQDLGELDRALEASNQAIALQERLSAPDLPTSLSVRGGIQLARHHPVEAAADLRQALSLLEGSGANRVLAEATRYDLARALWDTKATRADAVKMALEVRAYFAGAGKGFQENVTEVDEWLKTHSAR